MTALKIFLLAILFVASSGALFSEIFRTRKLATILAGCVAIGSTWYLFNSIYDDLVSQIANGAPEDNKVCLLYTSDAADE